MNEEKSRFEEIMEQINELVDEAVELLPDHEKDRATGYWAAHIKGALGGDYNHWLGGSMVDMTDSLKSFDEVEEEEEDWEDEEA